MTGKNPSQLGLETELKCQHFLIEQGFDILIPLGNYLKYDLVIVKDNKFYKIQVKHAHQKEGDNNSFYVSTKYDKRDNGRVIKQAYQQGDVDYFLTEFDGQFYMFPIFGTIETRFWLMHTGPNIASKKYAENYIAKNILSTL